MFIFTVLLISTKEPSSSLILTYPSHLAAGTLLALGMEGSRAVRLTSQDKHALRTRQALSISPADFMYYLDVNSEPEKRMRLFQAHYTVQELSHNGWPVASALLPRTRSIVLFSPPVDVLDEEVLNPLLIRLRQLRIAPKQTRLTVCVPTEQSLQCSQRQMMGILMKRRFLNPRFFGLVVQDRSEWGKVYQRTCPNFWHMAQGEFAEVRLVSCALGGADNAGHSELARVFQECPWGEYVDLPPRRALEMACAQDVNSLPDLQGNKERRRLLLSMLMNVALHSGDTSQRAAVINVWNRIDREVGTDWLVPLLANDEVSIRRAVVDAVCSRLPRSTERLVNMVLDEEMDRYDGAREAIIRAVDERIVGLLVDALDSLEQSRRKNAQDLLSALGKRSWSALVARMRKRSRAYHGQIGAASVLARAGDSDAQQFLQTEFQHTRPGSERRRIVLEGFEAWAPHLYQGLVEEEMGREAERRAGRMELLGDFFTIRTVDAAIGAIIFGLTNMIVIGESNSTIWDAIGASGNVSAIQEAFIPISFFCSIIEGFFVGLFYYAGIEDYGCSPIAWVLTGLISGFFTTLVLFLFSVVKGGLSLMPLVSAALIKSVLACLIASTILFFILATRKRS